ncbi:calcium-binding protein [Thermocoleostomius sinensis]|uniref:Calcium-binding protein n=1 Tax=Thermocoleostomius sinensis A174 TaxID=2016057 RepID=A0A9E8ZDR1_9CYAN|nr:calcium-binding protein [Thermocoleostomius sinensis]WAL61435.1 calcium-binding protein [Thermocoleostomius sinensis A174]
MANRIIGTLHDDVLFGDTNPLDLNDIILGLAGNDRLYGFADRTGGDLIVSHDTLRGGDGNDTLRGGAGDDQLLGEAGNDVMGTAFPGIEDDSAGEAGNDSLQGGAGNDVMSGGDGDDWLLGGTGDDLLGAFSSRGPGNDSQYYYGSDAGNDTLLGGDGNDYISGGDGNDLQVGGNGNDNIGNYYYYDDRFGQDAGDDTLLGGAGNDGLFSDDGNDLMRGGAGNDYIGFGVDGRYLIGDSPGDDRGFGDGGDDYIILGSGNDTMSGGAGNDRLGTREIRVPPGFMDESGNDRLDGGTGNDTLNGGVDRDTLIGGRGNDILYGDDDSDVLTGVDPTSATPGRGEQDVLFGELAPEADYEWQSPDRFILGNRTSVFYNDGRKDTRGNGDYAVIRDFDLTAGDRIQLKGSARDYSLGVSTIDPTATAIFYTAGQLTPELIGLVHGEAPSNLTTGFVYV